MYLMYVDESGDTGLINSPTKHFVLSGLVVHELRWQQYLDQLIDFRRRMKISFGLKLREEIHASAFINNPGKVARIPRHQRLAILRLFADELSTISTSRNRLIAPALVAVLPGRLKSLLRFRDVLTMRDFNVINVVVDKTKKPQDYDVFGMAWTALVQRFENTLAHHNFRGPANADERGIVFPDHTDDEKLTAVLRKMRRFNPIPNQSHLGLGSRNLVVRNIIEDPNFKDSSKSFFVQACDLIAFLVYQAFAPNAYMKKNSGQNYFKRIEPILCKVASNNDPWRLGIVKI